jgi:hypothetical protein
MNKRLEAILEDAIPRVHLDAPSAPRYIGKTAGFPMPSAAADD